jgi:hypothetical protein
MRDRGAIELALDAGNQRLHGRRIRTARSSWRHQARPQLSDDLFSHLRVVADMREVEILEHEIPGLEPRAVTGDAVLIEDGALSAYRSRGRWRGRAGGLGRRLWPRLGGGRRRRGRL